jgi:hypothetical protein
MAPPSPAGLFLRIHLEPEEASSRSATTVRSSGRLMNFVSIFRIWGVRVGSFSTAARIAPPITIFRRVSFSGCLGRPSVVRLDLPYSDGGTFKGWPGGAALRTGGGSDGGLKVAPWKARGCMRVPYRPAQRSADPA